MGKLGYPIGAIVLFIVLLRDVYKEKPNRTETSKGYVRRLLHAVAWEVRGRFEHRVTTISKEDMETNPDLQCYYGQLDDRFDKHMTVTMFKAAEDLAVIAFPRNKTMGPVMDERAKKKQEEEKNKP